MIALVLRLAVLVTGFATLALASASLGATEPTYSTRDLQRIVDPKPVITGWSKFEEADSYIFPTPKQAPAFTLHEWLGESPSSGQKTLAAKLAKAGFVIGRHRVWGGRNMKPQHGAPADAVVFGFLFRDASGARAGFRAFPRPPSALQAKELGPDAWGYHSQIGRGGEGAVYFWRRGNLTVLAEIVCHTDCGFQPVPSVRAYADLLYGRAKKLG